MKIDVTMPAAARPNNLNEDLFIGWGIEGAGATDGYYNSFETSGPKNKYSFVGHDSVEAMSKGPRVSFARAE